MKVRNLSRRLKIRLAIVLAIAIVVGLVGWWGDRGQDLCVNNREEQRDSSGKVVRIVRTECVR